MGRLIPAGDRLGLAGAVARLGHVLDQHERQRILALVPADAMLLVVVQTHAAVERRAAFANHDARAQDHHPEAVSVIFLQQHAVAQRLGPCVVGSLRRLRVGRRGAGDGLLLRTQVQRGDRPDMHQPGHTLLFADARDGRGAAHHGALHRLERRAAAAMGEVHDAFRAVDRACQVVGVADIAGMHRDLLVLEDGRQVARVARHDGDAQTRIHESLHDMRADEAGAAQDGDIGGPSSSGAPPVSNAVWNAPIEPRMLRKNASLRLFNFAVESV